MIKINIHSSGLKFVLIIYYSLHIDEIESFTTPIEATNEDFVKTHLVTSTLYSFPKAWIVGTTFDLLPSAHKESNEKIEDNGRKLQVDQGQQKDMKYYVTNVVF